MEQEASLRSFGRYAAPGILGQSRHILLHIGGCRVTRHGGDRSGRAQYCAAALQPDERHRSDDRRWQRHTLTICRAQEPAEGGRPRLYTCGRACLMAWGCFFLLLGVFTAGRSRGCSARMQRPSADCVYLRTLLCFRPFFIMNNVLLLFLSRNDGGPSRAMWRHDHRQPVNVVMDCVFHFPVGYGHVRRCTCDRRIPIITC